MSDKIPGLIEETSALDQVDWRAEMATTLAAPWTSPWTGITHAAGVPLTKATIGRWDRPGSLAFVTPSPEALALHIAMEAAGRCRDLRPRIDVLPPARGGEPSQVSDDALSPLYDYLESCCVVLTFAFQAIEAFANREIETGVANTYAIGRRGGMVELTSAEIQQQLSTDEKIGTVVPDLVGVESPRGRAPWAGYRRLKRERDAIVHLKAEDAYPRKDRDRPSIYHRFIAEDVGQHPRNVIRLIAWFYTSRPAPRWLDAIRQQIG